MTRPIHHFADRSSNGRTYCGIKHTPTNGAEPPPGQTIICPECDEKFRAARKKTYR